MSARKNENMKKLFEKFLPPQQAEEAMDDFNKGERILQKYPAPQPDDAIISNIKLKIAETLAHRKTNTTKRIVVRVVAAAAVFILLATASIKLLENRGNRPQRTVVLSIIPNAIWESDDILADDEDLAISAAEIEEIESDILALQLSENGSIDSDLLAELETELIEINSDFWKG